MMLSVMPQQPSVSPWSFAKPVSMVPTATMSASSSTSTSNSAEAARARPRRSHNHHSSQEQSLYDCDHAHIGKTANNVVNATQWKLRSSADIQLPTDPRTWLREDVQSWLCYMTEAHGLPAVQTDRFLMNGKALCLMTIDMFCQRVPLGGKLLYKDFQLRLAMAMHNDRQ